ncbi:hypothetical protein BSKO_08920 [Bryopsis sp. KO-2023]|nr:hypothetical protein BSKO_08920 [Bryopsis sp. KO-2023]
MQFASLIIACSLLVSPVLTGRDLKQTSCTAFGSIDLLKQPLRCTGDPVARCKSHEKAELRLRAAFVRINKQELCSEFTRFSVAREVAEALAEVYTEALSKVDCNGNGFCGYTVSQEDSFSSAYIDIFSRAVLDDGPFFVPCEADLKVVRFAKAAEDARSVACRSASDRGRAFSSAFVSSATTAIVQALFQATAGTCNNSESGSKCDLGLDDTPRIVLQGGSPVSGTTSGSGLVLHGPRAQPDPFKTPSSSGGVILQNPSGSGTTGGQIFVQVAPCSIVTYLDCCRNQLKCGGPLKLKRSPPFAPFAFPFVGSSKDLLFVNGSLRPTCLCP